MKKSAAYIFWYVCAVLLVVEIVVMCWFGPADKDGHDAIEVRSTLNKEIDNWNKLRVKATHKSPNRIFDAENKKDIDTLLTQYLITDKWQDVLEPQVRKYGGFYQSIKDDLGRRSEVLREAVGDTANIAGWYESYDKLAGGLVRQLMEADALVIESTSGAGGAGKDESQRRAREAAGLYLKGDEFPKQSEHVKLTAQLHIMERIARIVLAAKADVLPNPVLPADRKEPQGHVKISNVSWAMGEHKFDGPISEFATNHRLTVNLIGQESALSKAIADLEALDTPIVVTLGASLRRQERFKPGDRGLEITPGRAAPAPTMQATLELLVLDFAPLANAKSMDDKVKEAMAPKAGKAPTKGGKEKKK